MARFPDGRVAETLQLFLKMLQGFFGEQLVSVVLYGSIVFDDLAPGYGDLDFLAVVKDDLSEETCRGLTELRKPLRSGEYGELATMLEGAFLPTAMLDPNVTGSGFWWGTSRDRPWSKSELGWMVLHVIRERGAVIWGQDIRPEIPAPSREDLLQDLRDVCKRMPSNAADGGLHSIDWLLTAARLIYWLREDELSSKSEAADWGLTHAHGAWREHLAMAKQMRLNPSLAETDDGKRWLATLAGPISEAWRELRAELTTEN